MFSHFFQRASSAYQVERVFEVHLQYPLVVNADVVVEDGACSMDYGFGATSDSYSQLVR